MQKRDKAAKPGMSKTETYEEDAKDLFTKEPSNMKLLVVVDKLLTGFDAPPCTYMYIDKSMQDHGLFQAICRVNRLDGEDKDFGYIVDYKDLFKKVENAIAVYTSELDHSAEGADPEVLLQDRLKKGKQRLDTGQPPPPLRGHVISVLLRQPPCKVWERCVVGLRPLASGLPGPQEPVKGREVGERLLVHFEQTVGD